MADISDVEMTMVSVIADALQLGESYLPGSAVTSTPVGCQVRVYRGWPIAASLATDIAAGIANVTVFPVAGASRRTTKYFPQWAAQEAVAATIAATVSGATVIFSVSGVVVNQVIGIRFGAGSTPQTYTYRPTITDTAYTISAAFGGMIPLSTVTGPVLTIPTSTVIETIVAPDQSMWLETRRQEQHIWVIGWCPSPAVRDIVMKTADEGFANLLDPYGNPTDQFPLPDGSYARLLYMSNHTDDQAQRSGIWRRDLRYLASYPTTLIQTFPTLVFGIVNETEDTSENLAVTIAGP